MGSIASCRRTIRGVPRRPVEAKNLSAERGYVVGVQDVQPAGAVGHVDGRPVEVLTITKPDPFGGRTAGLSSTPGFGISNRAFDGLLLSVETKRLLPVAR